MKKTHIIWAIVAVVALGSGYFWGKASAGSGRFTFNGGQGGNFVSSTARQFGGKTASGQTLTAGQITAMDSSSITLQLPNGNSEVVFYSSSTEVTKPTTVPVSALSVGSNVAVGGTQNSDGSMTASSIQMRPAGGPGMTGGGAVRIGG